MTVETASPADAGELVRCYDWLYAPPGSPPPEWDPAVAEDQLRVLLASPQGTVFLVRRNGAVAGFVTVYLDLPSVRFGQRAWVEDLAVDPAARSSGFGKALLDAAKDWARTHGASHLELDSGDGRLDAHRFYEREQPTWTARSFGWVL